MADECRPVEVTVDGQAELWLDGCVVINTTPTATPEHLIGRYGFHPAQIVRRADGADAYSVVDVIRDAWFQAMWQAHHMTADERARWLVHGPDGTAS